MDDDTLHWAVYGFHEEKTSACGRPGQLADDRDGVTCKGCESLMTLGDYRDWDG